MNDWKFAEALKNKDPAVITFLRFLSLAHDVTVDEKNGADKCYSSTSPDELAFVNFTKRYGV